MDDLETDNTTVIDNSTLEDIVSASLRAPLSLFVNTGLIVFILIAILIGIPGNAVVLAVLTKNTTKTSTDWFIIFIAICDLLSLGINGSIDILKYQPERWENIGSPALCKIHYYILNGLFMISNFLILFVGVDRYFKTCRPHAKLFTPDRAFWFCVGVTIGSFACATPCLLSTTASSSNRCNFDNRFAKLRIVFVTSMILVCVVSSLVLMVLYSRIAIVLKRRASTAKSRRDRIRQINENRSQTIANVQSLGDESRPKRTQTTILNNTVDEKSTEERQVREIATNPTMHNNSCNGDSSKEQEDASCESTEMNRTFRLDINKRKTKINPDESKLEGADDDGPNVHNIERECPLQINRSGTERRVTPSKGHDQSKRVRKTTTLMFAISLLYIVSAVIPAVTSTFLTVTNLRQTKEGVIVITLALRLYTISNFANPLIYMTLSSCFRKKAATIIQSCIPW